MTAPRLLIVVNDVPFFLSHRLPIAVAALASGYQVAVAAPADAAASRIKQAGLTFLEMPMPRRRGSIGREIAALAALWRILGQFRPEVVHLVTAKPIIFGGIMCRLRRLPVLAAISGLGHVFVFDDLRSRIARGGLIAGYWLALKRKRALAIFQNRDNLAIFEQAGIVDQRFVVVRGSGTALAAFDPAPAENAVPTVLLPARMLWTKGVAEFVAAARMLRGRGCAARFVLAGSNDPGNPANIEQPQLEAWNREKIVEWVGYRPDIPEALRQADLVVLPSYLEGLPKTIVDAAAAGRAVVTTDVPGCRDAIVAGETGLLCRARCAEDLADKIQTLLADRERRLAMGRAARAFAEREFAIEHVVAVHLECYEKLRNGD